MPKFGRIIRTRDWLEAVTLTALGWTVQGYCAGFVILAAPTA